MVHYHHLIFQYLQAADDKIFKIIKIKIEFIKKERIHTIYGFSHQTQKRETTHSFLFLNIEHNFSFVSSSKS